MSNIVPQQLLHFEVQLPEGQSTNSDHLFLAGDFNGWHTADSSFELKKDISGDYKLDITLPEGQYGYKVVRGAWSNVEVARDGQAIDNRNVTVLAGKRKQSIHIVIENWADNFEAVVTKSTASENVHVIDAAFFMPQLDRHRRIWLYLPDDYYASNRSYPVLYLQDGQNIFDVATSFSGEWGVDKYLNSLPEKKQCIVVAIDNGGNDRMQEYNPYSHKKFGKGKGNAYVKFLALTLKPYVDSHYRTKTEKGFTAVGGSSMGGLISFYAALMHPDVFGTGAIFSPSFWIAPRIYVLASEKVSHLSTSAFYFYAGAKESEGLQTQVQKMEVILARQPGIEQKTAISKNGQHNEIYWQQAFPAFYTWWIDVME